ncbi:MAG: winged helix-turn-helix transcriptional regulator [Planctomycetota bacterium]
MGGTPRLVSLFRRRWAVPVIVELRRLRGAKFVTLAASLSVSRDTLSRTLSFLRDQGWVRRNPGYGHPMRPEYLLTRAGARIAPACARLLAALRALGVEEIALRRWSLPVAAALRAGARRFNEVKAGLPGVSARALTLSLKGLQAAGLVERTVEEGWPPRAAYSATPRARRLAPLLARL